VRGWRWRGWERERERDRERERERVEWEYAGTEGMTLLRELGEEKGPEAVA
jgi:hypothetical protein